MKRMIITFFALLSCYLVQSQSLGGVDLSRFVYGGNTTKTNYFNDPNDWYSWGFYNNSTGTNMPYQTWWHLIINRHVNESNNYQFQIATDFWGDNTYFRKLMDGNPTPWRRILNDGQDSYAANLNQFLRTTDQVSFSSLGIGTTSPAKLFTIYTNNNATDELTGAFALGNTTTGNTYLFVLEKFYSFGSWKTIVDQPHFQNLQGLTFKQLRELPKDEKGRR